MEMTRLIRVMITGVGGGTIGEQVCKALRLGRWQYEITVTNIIMAPALVVKAENYETLPHAKDTNYLESILALVEKHKIEFIIPGSESELSMLSQCREVVSKAGARMLINSDSVISTCLDKFKSIEFLAEHGFSMPVSFVGDGATGLDSISGRFPWVVKPAEGGGGSASAFIAQDQTELQFFVEYLLKQGHRPLIQEYIGNAENEYTVGVLNSPKGDLIGAVALRRQIRSGLSNRLRVPNRTSRSELGPDLVISSGISQGKLVNFEPVLTAAKKIALSLGSVGPINIQGRWDGSRFVSFEINPRFSGTTPMRAMAGVNEPELLIDWHLGLTQSPVYSCIRYGAFTRGLVEYFTPCN
jgi:carbamoyl-phosphate synthase large subunit